MDCVGIICEYNPFHNGHLYHLQTASALAGQAPVIAVMSGNYVQRAVPAITDKWARTRMALANGASVVLELPTVYSTAGSEAFASAGVRILKETGLVSHLSFGVENADADMLKAASHIVLQEPEEYTKRLKKSLEAGQGYAAARAGALGALLDVDPDVLRKPNTILAIEYYKALQNQAPSMRPLPILRSGDYHDHSLDVPFPSASAIRSAIRHRIAYEKAMPDSAASILAASPIAESFDGWSKDLHYRLCFHTPDTLRAFPEVSEGLENRILRCAEDCPPISELVARVSTKRYPKSRIRRILLRVLLNLTTDTMRAMNCGGGPSYIRVLGFRKDAETLLSRLSREASLPVVTNVKKQLDGLPEPARRMLLAEARYTDLYRTHLQSGRLMRGAEYTEPLIVFPG